MADVHEPRDVVVHDEMGANVPANGVPSKLPGEWVPEDAAIVAVARHDEDMGIWEAVIPEFTLAGMGNSPDAAFENALELLDDYLMLCAAEGKTFAQARRPLSRPRQVELVGEAIASIAAARLRRRRAEREVFRLPLLRALGIPH